MTSKVLFSTKQMFFLSLYFFTTFYSVTFKSVQVQIKGCPVVLLCTAFPLPWISFCFSFSAWQTHLSCELQLRYCLLFEMPLTLQVISPSFISLQHFPGHTFVTSLMYMSNSPNRLSTLSIGLICLYIPFSSLLSTTHSDTQEWLSKCLLNG